MKQIKDCSEGKGLSYKNLGVNFNQPTYRQFYYLSLLEINFF